MAAKFTESEVEEAALGLFSGLKCAVLHNSEVSPFWMRGIV